MKMYVANTTLQDQILVYRLPGVKGERTQTITAGNQVQIYGDLSTGDVAAIVEQQEPYGMIDAASVNQARKHVTMLYSTGAPVKLPQMKQALERNLFLMGEQGRELRAAAGVAVSQSMQDVKPDKFRGTEVTIEEVTADSSARAIDEHVVVSNRPSFIEKVTGGQGSSPPPSRRRQRRAA